MDKHLPGRIRSSTGEKSIHRPSCHHPLPPPLNDRTCLPEIKECPQMERGVRGGRVQQTKTARDKNTVSEFVLKSQNLLVILVITFVPFYFSLSHGVCHHLSPFLGMSREKAR
ncbi:hypothetical protein CDAR_541411 [Caerostris darwini]|uniref:Transmembrane protein n=1 Tax=Caerostris darwini TaxID=1538125 RepID=A0AAV4VWM8_9ARAC|nr:hypothetical protein CDAR_541411 [Caerostris darwini]